MDTLSAPILVSIYISTPCVACATSAERLDHLDPVNLEESKAYRTKLEKLLFVTEANYGRMSFNPGSDPEFVVSIYRRVFHRNKYPKNYYITVTQALDSIWYSMPDNSDSGTDKPIKVTRCDAEMPSSTALAIRRVWKQMLLQTRPHDYSSVDAPIGGEIVEFSLVASGRTPLFGELPIYPGKNTLALERLGIALQDYCKASPNERALLSEKIERKAEKLLTDTRRE